MPAQAPGANLWTGAIQGPSVLDSPLRSALKKVLSVTGMDDPSNQVMGILAGVETPGAAAGGVVGKGLEAVRGALKRRVAHPIKAYHGSPHDFDKFDVTRAGKDIDRGGSTFTTGINLAGDERGAQIYRGGPSGRMYEARVHVTPDELLQWEQPITAQSPSVRDALAQLPTDLPEGQPIPFGTSHVLQRNGQWVLKSGGSEFRLTHADIERLFGRSGQPVTAQHAFRRAEANLGEPEVQRRLLAQGVKGVAHADEHGFGTTDYVIWDDSLIDIAKKYGVAFAAAVGAMRARQQGASPAPAQGSTR